MEEEAVMTLLDSLNLPQVKEEERKREEDHVNHSTRQQPSARITKGPRGRGGERTEKEKDRDKMEGKRKTQEEKERGRETQGEKE